MLRSVGCLAGVGGEGARAAVMLPAPADLFRGWASAVQGLWVWGKTVVAPCDLGVTAGRRFWTRPSTGKAGVSLCEVVLLTGATSTFQGGEAENSQDTNIWKVRVIIKYTWERRDSSNREEFMECNNHLDCLARVRGGLALQLCLNRVEVMWLMLHKTLWKSMS